MEEKNYEKYNRPENVSLPSSGVSPSATTWLLLSVSVK